MAGLGVPDTFRSLSNCIVLPSPKDSYSSIMYVDTMLVSAAKRGNGYGLDISNLRPDGTEVKNAAKSSTGAVAFMERYSNSTREVAQAGRRGACLMSIDVRHPDVEKFALIKKDLTKVTGANISIKLRDDFMQAVKENGDYILRWPCEQDIHEFNKEQLGDFVVTYKHNYFLDPYNEIVFHTHNETGKTFYTKRIKAVELWNTIIENAHAMAEPGLFYWDKMKWFDPASVYKDHIIICTNACSEQPMSELDTCRLICINLLGAVTHKFKEKGFIDYDLLYQMSYIQLYISDLLVDLEIEYSERILEKIKSDPEPLEEKQIEITLWEKIKDKAIRGRRVGCGITALGDMLAAIGLKYDSDEALEVVEKAMKTKMRAELDASIDLSIMKGPFPDWDVNLEYGDNVSDFYKFLEEEFPEQVARMKKHGRRNINWSTIAPTGSVKTCGFIQ
jgi:ribonucleoside-diphosphate reductase alpha chain